jgi:hypothetical protein
MMGNPKHAGFPFLIYNVGKYSIPVRDLHDTILG